MEKIKEYLENRLKRLDYELGYFEDDDDGNNLASAKRTQQEIYEVNNLLILFSVTQAKRPVCPSCFGRGELRNDKEEITGTCHCHY